MEWLIVAVVAAVVLYIALSPDPFASALRAKIPGLQRRAASAVERVDDRVEAAKAAQTGLVRKGRRSLYEIQQMLAESELELDAALREIEDDKTAIGLARKNNDRETFNTLVAELNRDTAYHAQLAAHHEELVAELKSLEVTVDEQRVKEQEITMQGRVMVSKARVADVTTIVNEAVAGLTDSGADAHMAEAEKILRRTTARANAAKTAAGGLTPDERASKKADAYLKQARQGSTGVSSDELWEQMNAPTASSG